MLQRSIRYYCSLGILGFILGRLVPKRWFDPRSRLYAPLPFEKNGTFYDRFRIRFWHRKLPDMSRILPRLMPKKALQKNFHRQLDVMLQETCVAESVHLLLMLLGLPALCFMPDLRGLALWLFYSLFLNLPFVMIQRYNRPRLIRLADQIDAKRHPRPTGTEA